MIKTICSWFKKSVKKEYSNFYKTAMERQEILDTFIDNGICSSVNNCKSFLTFGKALTAQDIKYIYNRAIRLLMVMTKRKNCKIRTTIDFVIKEHL